MLAVYTITILSAIFITAYVYGDEKEWAAITSEATLNLVHFGQKSYYIGSIFKGSYHQGQQFCRYHGMQLLSIESQEENDFLQKIITQFGAPKERFWTSGSRLPDGIRWIWMSTGRPIIYENWSPGEPNDAKDYEEKCVEARITNEKLTWNDVNCIRQLNFICEISWPKDCYRLLQELNSTHVEMTSAPKSSLIDLRLYINVNSEHGVYKVLDIVMK